MVAVAETVHEKPDPWRPPRALHVVFGAMTIAAIIALVAIIVPLVSGSRVTPRNAPAEVFEPSVPGAGHSFPGYVTGEHTKSDVKKKVASAGDVKADKVFSKEDNDSHGSVEVNVEQHVQQSTAPNGGTATNVQTTTNSSSNGQSVSSSNHSNSSSNSVVVSNNGSSQASKSGTSKNSVQVNSSSKVTHKTGAADDWDDWGDDDWDDDWNDDWDD
jgi:hypothetical protein